MNSHYYMSLYIIHNEFLFIALHIITVHAMRNTNGNYSNHFVRKKNPALSLGDSHKIHTPMKYRSPAEFLVRQGSGASGT